MISDTRLPSLSLRAEAWQSAGKIPSPLMGEGEISHSLPPGEEQHKLLWDSNKGQYVTDYMNEYTEFASEGKYFIIQL